jgi:chemotaxis protein histidine kinase CheA
MNEVVREFLLETNENLAQLDLDLVTLEKSPTERETLARVFRTLHTVKGTAGFLGLPRLQALAHAAENLLSRLRSGELAFQGEIATVLLTVVDVIRQMLASIVVRTNIEQIGGTVEVDSRLGQGTAVKMKIPLTLAIIPALTVTSGGDRYAIPQVSLLELVRL